ncbi:MAG: substrate-binding domain-containing protein [Deltaproteobacteria bacterium]|nr:substrate-binding domain-containing protein [Deltaproteobacteria bacterium]MBW2010924.1 substrate-binding domain-containing protein [Deltaproteobacteria bacterium]MBW2100563.1 substrate-binding domain-containing protein [Deltaproteobacteria bacterium]
MKIKDGIGIFLAAFMLVCFSFPTGVLISAASDGDVIIIGNKNVPASSLSKKDIQNIYLGRKTKWDNNQKIIFVTLKKGEVHKRFIKEYVGKTSAQYRNYWKKQVFTGKGKAPKCFDAEEKLVDYVANTEGAIGYISSGTNKDSVKTISTN